MLSWVLENKDEITELKVGKGIFLNGININKGIGAIDTYLEPIWDYKELIND